MRCQVLVLCLCLIYANASPIDVVPEDSHHELSDELLQARKAVANMKAGGKTEEECRKLVKDTTTDITVTCTTSQKIIDELPDGSSCLTEGQKLVTIATSQKKKADQYLITTTTAVTVAENHKVEFGIRTFSSLTQGKCSSFYSSTAYVTARSTYKAAVSAKEKAEGAAKEASVALTTAISEATKAKNKCLCDTRAKHSKTFAEKTAITTNTETLKTWTKAHQIQCVLDHQTTCKIPAACTVHMGKVIPAVKEVAC